MSGQTPAALDSIDAYIQDELAHWRIPGLSVAVLRGDTVLLARGYGFANLEHHVPATDSTVYETGSVTKQFTAAAVVRLSEQGRISLDDPITRFLPEGSTTWRGVTIRHLLTHTSGISDNATTKLDSRRDYTEDELVGLAASEPLEFTPGDRESYSSTGYVLLGIIIHRITGVFYGDFLRDHIFGPLGMRTARVISEADIIPNRAAGYQFVNDTLKNQDWVSASLLATADGGLLFTVRDLAQWAIALNHGSVLSRAGLEASWTPVRLNDGGTYPYGFGWHIAQQRGYRRIGHSGSYQGFQATIQRYPDFDLTVIVMTNLAQSLPETMAFSIAGILEPRLTPPHRLSGALSGATPPGAIHHLLQEISAGEGSARITPGFNAFLRTPCVSASVIGLAAHGPGRPWAATVFRTATSLGSMLVSVGSATPRGWARSLTFWPPCSTGPTGSRRGSICTHSDDGPRANSLQGGSGVQARDMHDIRSNCSVGVAGPGF